MWIFRQQGNGAPEWAVESGREKCVNAARSRFDLLITFAWHISDDIASPKLWRTFFSSPAEIRFLANWLIKIL